MIAVNGVNGCGENSSFPPSPCLTNAIMDKNAICRNEFKEQDHPRDEDGKFTEGGNSDSTDSDIFDNQIKNSELYKNLPEKIQKGIEFIFTSKPVANIKGNEFPNNGENLNNRINAFYKEKYNNKVDIPDLGEVVLDSRSIKNSAYHGLSDEKVNAFAAVPEVLTKGCQLNISEKHNGKNEDRYSYIAPLTIKGEKYYCEAIVKSTKNYDAGGKNRFYVHEVELTKKLADVFTASFGGTSTSSKSIISKLIKDFNPIATNEIQSKYYNIINYINNWKGNVMTLEEQLFKGLFSALKAKNEAEEEKDKKEEKAENEDVDKRKLIDEVGGILKDKVDEEYFSFVVANLHNKI